MWLQIDKLVRGASESEATTSDGKDRMSLKPNLAAMTAADDQEEDGEVSQFLCVGVMELMPSV